MERESVQIEGRVLRVEDNGYVFMETADGERRAFMVDKARLSGKKAGDRISFLAAAMTGAERERGEEDERQRFLDRHRELLERRDRARESGTIVNPAGQEVPFTREIAAEVEEALSWGHAALRNPLMTKINERRQARLARERAGSE
jgi:hypothetical protein